LRVRLPERSQGLEERHHLRGFPAQRLVEVIELEILRGDRELTAAGSDPRVVEDHPFHGAIQGAKKIVAVRPGDLLPLLGGRPLPPERREHQRGGLEGRLAFPAEHTTGHGFHLIEQQVDIIPPEAVFHRALPLAV
jgi:hypothetical protein